MIKNFINIFFGKNKGFSLLEVLVSVALFAMILLTIISFFLSMNAASLKTESSREITENAREALEKIAYEIKSAKSIYTPTTTANQLSLETSRYLSPEEDNTFIDFFLCGFAVCFKKESQAAVALTSDSVRVTNLEFLQVATDINPSVHITITIDSFSLESTASLRIY